MKLLLSGAKIYPSPYDKPIERGNVLIDQEKVSKVGDFSQADNTKEVDCSGLIITSAFQNNHVHLEGRFSEIPAEKIVSELRENFTRYGFATIVDTGSNPYDVILLRSRIELGEILGPRILTAGSPIFPPEGIPFYLSSLSPEAKSMLDQPRTAEEATSTVQRNVRTGSDIIKIFTGALIKPDTVKLLPEDIAHAVVEEAHRLGRLVFTHPSNLEGVRLAIRSGVDVLAHTASDAKEWDKEIISEMLSRKMSLVPTLKLWTYEARKLGLSQDISEAFLRGAITQLKVYFNSGGNVVFGTDAGYMADYNPSDEYALMSRAGMPPTAILDSLTTAPAALFKESQIRGKIAQGMDADLVVLEGDPVNDVRNFARVLLTIRKGQVIYEAEKMIVN